MTDNINNPSHYTDGNIEVIDFIEDKQLGYHLGNVVKYVSRAGKKDPDKRIEDLKKAQWYLNRYIENNCPVVDEDENLEGYWELTKNLVLKGENSRPMHYIYKGWIFKIHKFKEEDIMESEWGTHSYYGVLQSTGSSNSTGAYDWECFTEYHIKENFKKIGELTDEIL